MSKLHLTNEDIYRLTDQMLVRYIFRTEMSRLKPVTKIYGIPRGGTYVARVAHGRPIVLDGVRYNFQMVDAPEECDLYVDDIIDSGSTRAMWSNRDPDTPFVALIDKSLSASTDERRLYAGKWIVFPWEKDEVQRDDTIVGTLLNRLKELPDTRCNANVSAVFQGADDRKAWEDEVQKRCRGLLDALLFRMDGTDQNVTDTPRRMAKMMCREVMAGRFGGPPDLTVFANTRKISQLIISGPIAVRSLCAHHMCPILGHAWIGYIPGERIFGLSKFDRLLDYYAARPQMQEEMTHQVHEHLEQNLQPVALAVMVRATHTCKTWRGVCADPERAVMITSSFSGALFEKDAARAEFLALARE